MNFMQAGRVNDGIIISMTKIVLHFWCSEQDFNKCPMSWESYFCTPMIGSTEIMFMPF